MHFGNQRGEPMKLSAVQVARLKTPGKYYDGKGLALQINKRGGKSWIFVTTHPSAAL